MVKYPIGIQSFATMREEGFLYVDKTDQVYRMTQGHVFFMARPRRFGKSLLVSTLKAYFQGRRDLFEGLKIMQLEKDWIQYPVIHFDFNGMLPGDEDTMLSYLHSEVDRIVQENGITLEDTNDLGLRFRRLIEKLHEKTGRKVVVLIDEYDKPLHDLLETGDTKDEERLKFRRELLRAFFSIVKATDEHLRFVFLTGITKFSQVSMFSGFNQPDDLTIDPRYDTILGITEQELRTVFAEGITELAKAKDIAEEQVVQQLKERYDGYHFSQRLVDVYNPFSIINALAKGEIRDYWFQSGNPSFLVRLLAKRSQDVMSYTGGYYPESTFIDYKADTANPLPMIFQAGYLTIKDYDAEAESYLLDYPNQEVKRGLLTLLANSYLEVKPEETVNWISQMICAMKKADLEQVRLLFTSFLAETPYSMRPKKDQKDREIYFHYTVYLLLRLISCYTVYTEKQLSQGRADCIIETPGHIYIFEFKLDGTAAEALQQVRQRGYAQAYLADQRPLHRVGASFSSQTGTIEEWETEDAAVKG